MIPRRLIRKIEVLNDDAQLHIEYLADQLRAMPGQCRASDDGSRLLRFIFRRVRRQALLAERVPPPSMLTVPLLSPPIVRELAIGIRQELPARSVQMGGLHPLARGIGGLSLDEILDASHAEPSESRASFDATDPIEVQPAWVREQLRVVARLDKRRRLRLLHKPKVP
ncbi:MAG TPA: hypothetical protein VKE26_26250 [Xanthobacteraceae bacterium]|nr:hypothetical protein [Xanthobacteraceae bacterium]